VPVEIDGADGGGQVVRTALAAAAVTGEPGRVESVRGDRPNPGLRPQHLAAVRALATVADAEVEGATEGSETLVFEPGTVRGGAVDVDVARRGFYPVGGGEVALTLAPWTPAPVPRGAADRGPVRSLSVRAVATDGLAGAAVAERLAGAVAAGLGDDDAVARLVREAPPDRDVDLDPDELRAGLGDGGNEDVGAGADGPGSGPAVDAGVAVGTAVDYVEAASPGASVLLVVEHGDADGEGGATDDGIVVERD
jgi:RNA 3'-terminal phosphate cyclase (ATP)